MMMDKRRMNRRKKVCQFCADKTEAIDYILATKVFRKFEGLNLSLIRDEIRGLILYMDNLFGKGAMKECIEYLQRLQKMTY